MQNPKLEEIRNWVEKAQQDLLAAKWLLGSPEALYGAVGFHCQQASEKALKGYLTWIDQPFEKSHSLVAIIALCLNADPTFEELRQAATTLTPYAVSTRYPGDLLDLTRQEADEALELAYQIWDFILDRLPAEAKPIK